MKKLLTKQERNRRISQGLRLAWASRKDTGLTKRLSLKNPQTDVYVCDCRQLTRWLPAGSIDLLFCDPPYNIGVNYDSSDDNRADYWEFTQQWLETGKTLLSPAGSFFIYVPAALGHRIAVHIESQLGLSHVNTICVIQRFGQHETNKFISGYRTLLYFCVNRDTRIWNMQNILVDSDRKSKYADKRTDAKATNRGKRVPLDLWDECVNYKDIWGFNEPYFGRVQGNNAERRRGHPNQVPEKVIERVILAASAKGDLVGDFFVGSGTTPTVARALGRTFVGTEISYKYAKSAINRVRAGPARAALTVAERPKKRIRKRIPLERGE